MTETLVIGGGLAGAAAAAELAARGRRVVILERETEPRHKICGEFLSGEAIVSLRRLGLDPAALGASSISHVRLVCGGRLAQAALPFAAMGLTRHRLDAALLDQAGRLGAKVDRGIVVRRLTPERIATNAGDLDASQTILASGKHEVRGARRKTQGALDGYVGFKALFRLGAAERQSLAGLVEITLFEGGYAGLQLVEDGLANLCLLVSARRFAQLGRTWEGVFAALLAEPNLAQRLSQAQSVLERPLSISAVPYGFVHQDGAQERDDLFRVGDQAAVIPSFCGDGMAIALHSGRAAARAIDGGGGARAFHAQLRADVAPQVRLAALAQRVGETNIGRATLVAAARAAPELLALAAARTRLPARAIAA